MRIAGEFRYTNGEVLDVGRRDIASVVIPVKPRTMDICFEINFERKSLKVKPLHCGIKPLRHC